MNEQSVNQVIAVDLGGTKIRVAFINSLGQVGKQVILPTEAKEGPQAIISSLIAAIQHLRKLNDGRVDTVGIAVAGQVEAISGNVLFAPNLYWQNVPIGHIVSEALGCPVAVENDVRAATWGEISFGAGRGIGNLVCLFFGTGVGGGIVADGHLLTGNSNSAGEVGHMVLNFGGRACTCGNRGCWETIVGGWAIGRMTKESVKDNPKGRKIVELAGGQVDQVEACHLFAAASENDPFAQFLLCEIEQAMVAGVASLVNIFNPEVFVLGGGVIEKNAWLIPLVEEGVRQQALKSATKGLKFCLPGCGEDAPLLGVAMLALQRLAEKGYEY